MFPRINGKALTILKWLWMAVVLGAAILYFSRNFNTAAGYLQQIHPSQLVFSLVLMLAAKSLFGLISRLSIQGEGWEPTYRQMFSIYSLTQLAKYIPGGIWHYVGRFGIYRARDLSSAKAGKAMLLENLWLAASAFGTGAALLVFFERGIIETLLQTSIPSEWSAAIGTFILVAWLVGMILLQWFTTGRSSNRFQRGIQAALALSGAWILAGWSFALLLPEEAQISFPLAAGGLSISWGIGFLTVFAPGGLGIREVLLTMFFASALPGDQAAVLATIHRLVWVTSEILLGVFFTIPAVNRKIQADSPSGPASGKI